MTRKEAEAHALHICRTMGVDDETALLGGLPTYLMGVAEEAIRASNAGNQPEMKTTGGEVSV